MKIELHLEEQDAHRSVLMSGMDEEMVQKIQETDPDFKPETDEEFEERLKDAEGKFLYLGQAFMDGEKISLRGPRFLPEKRKEAQAQMIQTLTGCVISKITGRKFRVENEGNILITAPK